MGEVLKKGVYSKKWLMKPLVIHLQFPSEQVHLIASKVTLLFKSLTSGNKVLLLIFEIG